MNAGYYWITISVSVLLGMAWMAARANKRGMKTAPVFIGTALGVALAFLLAKTLYVALMAGKVWPRYGVRSFLRMDETEFSFLGGCLGMVLGMALTAKRFKIRSGLLLSAFAPAGALMAAGARAAEGFLGMQGVGKYVEIDAFARPPFAVSNEWGEWYWAIFLLSALAALIVAAVFAFSKKEDAIVSLRFERTVYYLCVPQIFCESLRSMGMRWGFVRAEQVLCAVVIVGLLVYGCLQTHPQGFFRRFGPVLGAFVSIAAIVGVEFGLDKTNLPPLFWYGVMVTALINFGVMEHIVTGRRLRQAR